jgi:hypothetical protein
MQLTAHAARHSRFDLIEPQHQHRDRRIAGASIADGRRQNDFPSLPPTSRPGSFSW